MEAGARDLRRGHKSAKRIALVSRDLSLVLATSDVWQRRQGKRKRQIEGYGQDLADSNCAESGGHPETAGSTCTTGKAKAQAKVPRQT